MQDKDTIIQELNKEIKQLREYIKLLEEKIGRLEKNSSNSSKPPSSDIVKPSKILRRLGKKRKRGGQHGHRKFSRQPFESEQVDEIRKGGLPGADITAAVGFMKGGCHMSYTTIQQFFKGLFELDISRGMLCKAALKLSQSLQPAYEQLAERLRHESQIGIDETGHYGQGKLHWTWCFDTPDYSGNTRSGRHAMV
jgi:hypothetical protein